LSRAALERIAAAALGGDVPADPREAALASHLRAVTRLVAARPRRAGVRARRRTGAASRAYFLLKASETPETVASLLNRVSDRLRRP
jgi:hypothetical protein